MSPQLYQHIKIPQPSSNSDPRLTFLVLLVSLGPAIALTAAAVGAIITAIQKWLRHEDDVVRFIDDRDGGKRRAEM